MWRNTFTLVIFFLVPAPFADSSPSGHPAVQCSNRYIDEGKSLECECHSRSSGFNGSLPMGLRWPGFSNSSKMKVMNVSRADNGTVFTCLVTYDGQNRTADYILEVSYGPDNKNTRIHGPVSFITNGSQWLSLTCNATEVNPHPLYIWDGVTFDNNDMDKGLCVFKPQPLWDDGREAICTAKSQAGQNLKTAIARFRLNLTYPPPWPPEIYGYESGPILTKGDKLHCKVSGGKPLVKKVIFSCSSDTLLEDQEDTTFGSSVYSNVTVSSGKAESFASACNCSAIWEPRDDFYTHVTRIAVFVKANEGKDLEYQEQVKIGLAVASSLGLIFLIITDLVMSIWMKLGARTGGAKASTESCKQYGGPSRSQNTSDYEDIDRLGMWNGSNSDIPHGRSTEQPYGVLYSKTDFPVAKFLLRHKRERPKIPGHFKSSSAGLNLIEQTESSSNPSETTHLPEGDSENVYTEIDITGEGTSLAALTHACRSSNALIQKEHHHYDKAAGFQSFALSPFGDEASTKKVQEGLYNILQR